MSRQLRRFAPLAVALGLGLALTLTAEAKKQPVAGKVTFLKGKAESGPSAEGPWKKLKRNKSIHVGDFVRTLDDSRLELRFEDKSIVRIGAASVFHVGDAKVDVKRKKRNVTASLVAGKAWASVSSLVEADQKFEIKTENAVAGVRGTTFRIDAEQDASTLVKVYAGAVAVSNAPFFKKKTADADKPKIDFEGRKQVATPFEEVSKKEWEQLCGEWMAVKVAADGTMQDAYKFAAKEDMAEDWVAWNLERDKESAPHQIKMPDAE